MNYRLNISFKAIAIPLAFLASLVVGCAATTPRDVEVIGRIQNPGITESSGVEASRAQSNVFWTHTDGGGRKQVLYAMTRTGASIGQFVVTGALITDWEDIASDDKGHIFVGDIGNNDARRSELSVHMVDEPLASKGVMGTVAVKQTWRLRFPAKPFDCESLFIWKDHGYVISKVFDDSSAELYRFSLSNISPFQVLEKVTKLKIDSPVTGATISVDGHLLGIVAKNGAYVCKIKGDPARAGEAKLHHTKFSNHHIEGCTFVPEGLLATSEERDIYLFTDKAFRGQTQADPKSAGRQLE